MPTYTKSAEPAPVAARLNYLEEKVRNLNPGEAPDLTAVIAGLNRLYEMTMRGSQYSSGPITYETESFYWNDGVPPDEPESGKSIVRTIFGSYTEAEQFESTAMVHQLLATPGAYQSWRWSQPFGAGWKSLAMAAFGSPTLYDELLPNGTDSLLALIKALQEQVVQLQDDLVQERLERKAADEDLQDQIDRIP